MKRLRNMWMCAVLAAMLAVLAGCQSIGGLNLVQVMDNAAQMTSAESSQTIRLEVVPRAEAELTAEEAQVIKVINSLQLNLKHIAVQDTEHLSAQGDITYLEQRIPFQATLSPTQLLLQIEGMKRPLSISLQGEGLDAEVQAMVQNNQSMMQQMTRKLGSFIVKQFPLPKNVQVTSVVDTVYGQSMSLTKLHVAVQGDEIIGLVKGFLTNIAKDEAGLREIIQTVVDAIMPLVEQSMLLDQGDYASGSSSSEDMSKSLVDEAYQQIKTGLDQILKDYDSYAADIQQDETLQVLLGKDTSLAFDVFVDQNQQIRKQNVELKVKIPDKADLPIQSLALHLTSETWNINGKVNLLSIDTSAGTDDVTNSYDLMSEGSLLNKFRKNSATYNLLRNTFEVGAVNFPLYQEEAYGEDDYLPGWWEFEGTDMVPIHELAYGFDASVSWDADTKTIVLRDSVDDLNIICQVGSTTAYLDGMPFELPMPVVIDDYNTANVPIQAFVQVLGGNATYDAESEVYTITRS